MKKASTLISAIIAIVVLLAALGVGFSVKQFRVHRAEKAVLAEPEPEVKKPVVNPALPGGVKSRESGELSAAQRSERQDERERTIERVKDMSEDERREFMREQGEKYRSGDRREGMGGGRRPGGFGGTDEERQAMKERFNNMTDEERQQFREQMMRRGGRGRGGPRGGGPGGDQDGTFRRRGDGEAMRGARPDGPREN